MIGAGMKITRRKATNGRNPVAAPRALKSVPMAFRDQAVSAGADRRRKLWERIQNHKGVIAGSELARQFGISRQSLVQDVAILRASGKEILSTPQGYRLATLPAALPKVHRAVLASQHAPERTEEELHILVDNGVKVLDVIVEHPLYGELRGALMLSSRADVADFMKRWRGTKTTLLSSLTRGVHLHTVEAAKQESIERAKAELHARGLLLR
jgi:transcriptional regulator of NAD metabolism